MTSKTTETASGTSTDDRTSFVVGTITSGSSTVSSVSTADLALLAVGETISHAAFPAGTTVSSKGANSFVASANATASATGATIRFENRLNQIMRQVVTPAGGSATTWRYAYNANGCMTSKTDGTNSWTLTWDDDNRLTRVQGPGGVDVSYQYDSLGRMLTRVSGGVTTRFTWDGWNCVKEDDGTNVFRWYCPEGELHSFERNSTFYQVHSDALGSVRAITDSSGAVVGSYSYGAWGETTSASHPSGFTMPWLFVGAWGVRFDQATGLHYMRNRWYEAGLGRFLSRDELGSLNRYEYCSNDPVSLVDLDGLKPQRINTTAPGGPYWHDVVDGVPTHWNNSPLDFKPRPKPIPAPIPPGKRKPCPEPFKDPIEDQSLPEQPFEPHGPPSLPYRWENDPINPVNRPKPKPKPKPKPPTGIHPKYPRRHPIRDRRDRQLELELEQSFPTGGLPIMLTGGAIVAGGGVLAASPGPIVISG